MLKKLLKCILTASLIAMIVVISSDTPAKADVNSNVDLVTYALQFLEDPNIPYVYGGPGRGKTLETCHDQKLGTDCSGFVASVYMHFGITVPGNSSAMRGSGYQQVKLEDALPGDICWWDGHVGLFAGWTSTGQPVLLHTNTAHASPPGNLIHANIMGDMEELGYKTYRKPTLIFRVVSSSSQNLTFDENLGNGSTSGIDGGYSGDSNFVKTLDGLDFSVGSLVTESDLTGMVLEWSAIDEQKSVNLPTYNDLTMREQISVGAIAYNMKMAKSSDFLRVVSIIISLVGILAMLYGMCLILALIFDKVNTFLEIHLLSILTFGKWVLVEHKNELPLGHENNPKGTKYLTPKAVVARVLVLIGVALFLVNGTVYKLIIKVISMFVER